MINIFTLLRAPVVFILINKLHSIILIQNKIFIIMLEISDVVIIEIKKEVDDDFG